jgi:hypothetical protein
MGFAIMIIELNINAANAKKVYNRYGAIGWIVINQVEMEIMKEPFKHLLPKDIALSAKIR